MDESTHRKKIPHEMTLHGETRVDDYYWLRDDKRENSEVLDYLRAENNYGKKSCRHSSHCRTGY